MHLSRLQSFLFCLHNCFMVPPDCPGPGPPGGSPARRQAAQAGWGTCQVLLHFWSLLACLALNWSSWRRKSIRLYPHCLTDSPWSPPSAAHHCCHNDLSRSRVESQKETEERKKKTGGTRGSVTHLQKTLIWFLGIKGMKGGQLTKPVPVVMIIQYQTEVNW